MSQSVVSSCATSAAVAGGPRAAWPRLREVIVTFKTHFDIGYTDLARNVVESYRTAMIDKALAVCDATRELGPEQQFIWMLPGWPLTQILGPGQSEPRRRRVLKAIAEGRLVWHALPVTTHTESLELEDVVRGLGFSSALARSVGQPLPRDAKMTDVPSHVWSLPTILVHAGVEFLHLGVNAGSSLPEVPTLFWWEGPDGSRLLTMMVLGYGTGLLPPPGWPHETWLALIHTKDNEGPPEPQQVRELYARAAAELPGVRVRMGRLSDFADAIRRERPDLPVVRADMPDTWIHGLMSMPTETARARRVRPQLVRLEAGNTLLRAWKLDVPDAAEAVAAAWERSLMFGEHTWGMDVKLFGERAYGREWSRRRAAGEYAKLEASWAEQAGYARELEGIVGPLLERHDRVLASAVKVAGPRVVVFNPLAWERDDVVEVDWPDPAPAGLEDADTGEPVPFQHRSGRLWLRAGRVPALGYRTYRVSGRPFRDGGLEADRAAGTISNGLLRVALDSERGGIRAIHELSSGRQLVSEADGLAFGQYLYERFDASDVARWVQAYNVPGLWWVEGDFGKPNLPPAEEVPHALLPARGFDLRMDCGAVSATARMTVRPGSEPGHRVALAVTLHAGLPWVDLEWSIEAKPETPWPEAGWLCLPVAVGGEPRFRLGRLGAVTDPIREVQPGTNHHVFCVNTGVTVTDSSGAGLGICPVDAALVSLGEPGLWRYSRRYTPSRPVVYVNLYNNQWSTNWPQWIGGSWSSRIRVWPVNNAGTAGDLIHPGWEARARCSAMSADGPGGSLPTSAAGIGLSRAGMLVTAFGRNPDGEGLLLRLWEQAGSNEACRVTLPAGLRPGRVRFCDLRGRPTGREVMVRDGRFELQVRPYAPISLLLE